MSLRLRLLIVSLLLVATYAATAWLIISAQRDVLIGQVDDRLRSLPPAVIREMDGRPPVQIPNGSTAIAATDTENPFSDVFIAAVSQDRTVQPLVVGTLLSNTPDVLDAVDATNGESNVVTIRAEGTGIRYRAIVEIQDDRRGWIVAAQSLQDTDATIDRLIRTFWIAGAVSSAVLGVGAFWVHRLGLRPIARVTAAAEALTNGDRSHRVEIHGQRTEAGKLAHAFNLMLDERDTSDARLRQFVADASHELRTPLTSIRGYLELYAQGAFEEKSMLDDAVRRLSSESARMHGLVEDLLALASLDEQQPLRQERVDLGQLLTDAKQDAQAVQPERTILLVVPASGLVVVGDPARLTQVVGILVSNALVHTPPSASVILQAHRRPEHVELVIADKGPGLTADAATRVFDRFWRGQPGRIRTKRQGHGAGAGLGLSIAHSIVGAHGGSIDLRTAPGAGCVFTVCLPYTQGGAGS